jgi:RNA polymerase sigma-70 factor, ECF subfamily
MPTTCPRRHRTKTALSNPWKYTPAPVRTDEDLLAEYIKTSDQVAFGELVRRYERELYSYLRNILDDTQLAEDAFQATFLKLHLKCRLFEPGRRLRPWLYAIANNQAVDFLRRNRRHKLVRLDSVTENAGTDDERHPLYDTSKFADTDPGKLAHAIEDRQRISFAMEKIPEKLRQVLIMVVYQGLKYREAAKALGIPQGTLKSRMHKALQSLHKAIIAAKIHASRHTPKTMLSWKE